jgi:hypothetical protein
MAARTMLFAAQAHVTAMLMAGQVTPKEAAKMSQASVASANDAAFHRPWLMVKHAPACCGRTAHMCACAMADMQKRSTSEWSTQALHAASCIAAQRHDHTAFLVQSRTRLSCPSVQEILLTRAAANALTLLPPPLPPLLLLLLPPPLLLLLPLLPPPLPPGWTLPLPPLLHRCRCRAWTPA